MGSLRKKGYASGNENGLAEIGNGAVVRQRKEFGGPMPAERLKQRLGLPEVRRCTNVVTEENVGLYLHLGFEETHRA